MTRHNQPGPIFLEHSIHTTKSTVMRTEKGSGEGKGDGEGAGGCGGWKK